MRAVRVAVAIFQSLEILLAFLSACHVVGLRRSVARAHACGHHHQHGDACIFVHVFSLDDDERTKDPNRERLGPVFNKAS